MCQVHLIIQRITEFWTVGSALRPKVRSAWTKIMEHFINILKPQRLVLSSAASKITTKDTVKMEQLTVRMKMIKLKWFVVQIHSIQESQDRMAAWFQPIWGTIKCTHIVLLLVNQSADFQMEPIVKIWLLKQQIRRTKLLLQNCGISHKVSIESLIEVWLVKSQSTIHVIMK